jgi:peptide/nickel transport system substrate-binding protein
MRRKTTLAVATASAALMTLAACGGGSDNGGGTPEDGASFEAGGGAAAGKNPDLKGPKPVPDDAQQGGTLTVMTDEAPTTLDPTRAYYTDSTAILSDLVIRALTQYVRDPESDDMVLVPDMATDLGRPNEDNTEWTFTLKDGLKYEDGTDVKAEDVAYAVKRTFAIAELPDGPTYNTTFFLDGDKYKGPFSDKSDYKGVVANGKDVTIKMRRPFADMDFYASFPAFTAIPEAKDDPETYGQHPLATGPYKFEDYKPGTSLTLTKNENWDPATDPGRIQSVDTWDFQFGQDTAKLENVLINDNGSAQTSLTYDNVTAASYRQISEEPDRLTRGTSPCTYFGYIDVTKVKDLKVRQAIGWAWPYEAY